MPVLMGLHRVVLFAVFQALIAAVLFLGGADGPWRASQGWWLHAAALTNVVSIALLVRLQRAEGRRYRDLFHWRRATLWPDLGLTVLVFALSGVFASLPNTVLATWLWGAPEVPGPLMFRPLPLWAVGLAFAMPVLHVFAELPTYFGYVMPRMALATGRPWRAWAVASFLLALQHVTLPLIFDGRYLVWRLGMFLPFAFFIGLSLKWRPSLMPYLVVGHGLIDLPLVFMVLAASR